MDAIKKFFEKKKKDAKFKLAGEGRRLDASSFRPVARSNDDFKPPPPRTAVSQEAQRAAAAAAISRVGSHSRPTEVDWSQQAIKAQAKRELEMEKKLAESQISDGAQSASTSSESVPLYATEGVYFYCSLIGPRVGTFEEIKSDIREFLYNQLDEDKGIAACLIIHTCNRNKEKVQVCVETLCKYLENIISNPDEEKYQKIRKTNRAYEDRVAGIEGTKEFLEAAGFVEENLPFNDSLQEFWVFHKETVPELLLLESLRDTLVSAEPLRPELDRGLKLLSLSEASKNVDLPPEFFTLSVEELKKEMQQRTEEFERSQMLLTKATRERMELREIKKYRFSLIRIKFPGGVVLQGTFKVHEKLSAVYAFVREHLAIDWRPFFLTLGGSGKITEEDLSLFELRLVPAVLLNFQWDDSISDPNLDNDLCLKEETLLLLRTS